MQKNWAELSKHTTNLEKKFTALRLIVIVLSKFSLVITQFMTNLHRNWENSKSSDPCDARLLIHGDCGDHLGIKLILGLKGMWLHMTNGSQNW